MAPGLTEIIKNNYVEYPTSVHCIELVGESAQVTGSSRLELNYTMVWHGESNLLGWRSKQDVVL